MQFTDHILDAVHQYFERCPKDNEHQQRGTEYELLQQLQDQGVEPFNLLHLTQTHALFQAHFLVRRALYQLQQHYHDGQHFNLLLELTRLTRQPWQNASTATLPGQLDAVRDYYLDLNNLHSTTPDDVDSLLNSFWQRYLAQDHKSTALRVLGLDATADFPSAKQRYRQLVQQHHPDKGGDTAHFQTLQDAMATLERCFRR